MLTKEILLWMLFLAIITQLILDFLENIIRKELFYRKILKKPLFFIDNIDIPRVSS